MVRLFVTYMEQVVPPDGPSLRSPDESASIVKERPDPDSYIQLNRAIGAPLQWDERLRVSRDELVGFLTNPSTAIYVLRHEGRAIGLCEFAGLGERDVELKHFGLILEFQGRRLGSYLLDAALRAVWSHGPDRVWLHTDTHDHPKAKAVYERSGFKTYAQAWEEFPD